MSVFTQCFAILLGKEGGYSDNPTDPGNWTGGVVGKGVLAGTKYGISAASYPNVDIAGLTLAQAQAIYQHSYWARIAGDALPPPLALLVFDAAVNNGVTRAVDWLQQAAACKQDGVVGPVTLAAVAAAHARNADGLMIEFQSLRLLFMVGLPTWADEGLGWTRRLCGLPFKALPLFPTPAKEA